jgi:hypothetical protein
MRRDYLTWGLIAFALGALLTWAIPDNMGGTDARNARDVGAVDTNVGDGVDQGANWTDILGWVAMLVGIGLALAGIFSDEIDRARLTRR